MVSPHSCLYLLLIVLAGFLFLTLALLFMCQHAVFCLITDVYEGCTASMSVFVQGLSVLPP